MKRVLIFLISLLLINYSAISSKLNAGTTSLSTDSISVLSAPDLYNLSVRWATEYNTLFPGTKIQVINISDPKIMKSLLEKGDIGFVSNGSYSGLTSESMWKAVIGRDVIVPVINSKNPYLEVLNEKGVAPENFNIFLKSHGTGNWGTLLKGEQNSKADFYFINDESILKGIAGFIKSDKSKITGIKVESIKEFLTAIKKNPDAIGFCKLINIIDPENQSLAENIRLLPIDRNSNGMLDANEKIYNDFNNISRGIWIGKYPKSLFINIYSISSNPPKKGTEIAFLKWILTDGQKFLYSNGYSDLLVSERQSVIDKLYDAQNNVTTTEYKPIFKTIILILGIVILAGFIVDLAVRFLRRKKSEEKVISSVLNPVLDENSLILPGGLYFDKTHTWAFMEQNGVVKVGIDDFLQHITGTLTRIKMKNEGDRVKKGEPILSLIQNGKQLNVYAPVSGIIREINNALIKNASILNCSPYNDGWVYRIEPTNWSRENQLLFMADKHKQFIKNEFVRLKDFLASALREDTGKYALLILQDGGELADSPLASLGPEVWEDFQSKFIDPSRQVWFYELF